MNRRTCAWLIVCGCVATAAYSQEPGFPLWAYGYVTYPSPPVDWSVKCVGELASDCDRPGGLPTDPQNTPRRLEGSDRTYTVAEINARYGPADWFPGDHPPMPEIVAHGKQANGARACGICHLPNGKGLMQNGSVSGLPKEYILQQLADFKSGKRHTADKNKANGYEMAAIARALSDIESEAAAEYFSSIKYTRWVRVVESETVPKFTATINGLFLEDEGSATEPLGRRIVEMPEDTYQTNILRNPRSGFVAYVPVGSLKAGENLVTTGGAGIVDGKIVAGRTMACGTCHGMDMKGLQLPGAGAVPPIAGRSPGYIGRALYDMKQGARSGAATAFMKPVVAKLTEDDLIAISAYISSLEP